MAEPAPPHISSHTSSPVKPSQVSGYEASRPDAEKSRAYMVDDMRGQWVGLIPPSDFIDTFMPRPGDCPPTPSVPKYAFCTKEPFRTEKDMYKQFIDVLNKYQLTPGFKLVDTSDYKDHDSYKGREIKPDPTLYAETVDTKIKKTQWSKVELNVEMKTSTKADAFCDPLSPEDMSEEDRREYNFLSQGIDRESSQGQLANYVAEWFARQHRCFGFTLFIVDPYIRFIRWDRAGAIVSQLLNFREDCTFLVEFFWRFSHTDDAGRGVDSTVRDPSPEEEELAKKLLNHFKKKKERPIKVFYVPAGRGIRRFVGWYPKAEPWALTGRCTRAYPVVDLTSEKVMFLKDVWRADVLGKESEILTQLNKAGVRHVPSLECGDDIVGQSTLTDRYDPANTYWALGDSWRVTRRVHNRLVVDVVARPLEEFETSKEMLTAVYHAFLAHKDAYTLCQILHRDISLGNILIDDGGNGVLIDWDLARRMNDTQEPRKHERTGTWAFMSYLLQQHYGKLHTMQDDMESFLYVVFYLVTRYLTHNRPTKTRTILNQVFDYSWRNEQGRRVGGEHKLNIRSLITPGFALPQNEPLTKWIWKVLDWVKEWIDTANAQMTESGELILPLRAGDGDIKLNLEDHEAMESLFIQVLGIEGWPTDDRAKDTLAESPTRDLKPNYPHRDQANVRRSKRDAESSVGDGSSGSSKKSKQG